MRRAIGLGGATFVAVGAVLVLTLPASAHNTLAEPGCASDGHATIHIHTTQNYDTDAQHPKSNTVTAKDEDGVFLAPDPFGQSYTNTVTLDGTKAHTVTVHVQAWNDPQGKNGWTLDIQLTTTVCGDHKPPSSTTYPPSSTTAPPTSTKTTTAPETTTAAATGGTTTTTTAVVAAATTDTANTLPFTGVNATFPLLIAGVLVIAGGGILLWLRLAARRRRTES
jgi:hypothetical protein